jgi:cytochrome c
VPRLGWSPRNECEARKNPSVVSRYHPPPDRFPILEAKVVEGAVDVMARSGFLVATVLTLASPCHAQTPADPAAGEDMFKKACGVCHTVEPNAPAHQGPNLRGVYGRASAQMAGFKYSEALAGAHLTWDDATLDRWLTNPTALVPGTVMPYRQRDQEKRAQIIAYLKSLGSSN